MATNGETPVHPVKITHIEITTPAAAPKPSAGAK